MSNWSLIFVFLGSYLFIALFPMALIYFWRKRRVAKHRSPLTQKLLRGPGETLRTSLDDANDEMLINMMMLPSFPLLIYAIHLSQSYFYDAEESLLRVAIDVIFAALAVGYFLVTSMKLTERSSRLRQGYEGEVAVAQELNQLMRLGGFVFHDVPGEGFNIDHVVVLPNGVYAVETKSRMKPKRGRGIEDATVIFDGNRLNFPNWSEAKPIEQASRQAQWLSRWLTSAVGENVKVRPALALPGWKVERRSTSNVVIYSGKNATGIFGKLFNSAQSEEMCSRIAHQLEQRCRDVEPRYFKRQEIVAA